MHADGAVVDLRVRGVDLEAEGLLHLDAGVQSAIVIVVLARVVEVTRNDVVLNIVEHDIDGVALLDVRQGIRAVLETRANLDHVGGLRGCKASQSQSRERIGRMHLRSVVIPQFQSSCESKCPREGMSKFPQIYKVAVQATRALAPELWKETSMAHPGGCLDFGAQGRD